MQDHELTCRFCGTKTGELGLPNGMTLEEAGVVDIRCDEHKEAYGTYQELEQKYEEVGKTAADLVADAEKHEFKLENVEKIVEETKVQIEKQQEVEVAKKKAKKVKPS